MTKWSIEGRLVRPTLRNSTGGCIYYAMKRLKRATDKHVQDAAIEDGLLRLTIKRGNDLKKLVQDELRRLAAWRIIVRTRPARRAR